MTTKICTCVVKTDATNRNNGEQFQVRARASLSKACTGRRPTTATDIQKKREAVKYPAALLVAPFLMIQKGIKGVSVISSPPVIPQRAIVSYKTTTHKPALILGDITFGLVHCV